MSDHMFCHTAQKYVGESRPPMRPHDNQIHPLLVRGVQNRLRGGALDEEALALEPGTLYSLSTRLQEVLRIGLQVVQQGGSHPGSHVFHGHRAQVGPPGAKSRFFTVSRKTLSLPKSTR